MRSDGIDGYIARRRGPTAAGAFLDPLADKVLVLGAMFTLVGTEVFWVVPVIIIAARELIISVYRVVARRQGDQRPGVAARQVQDGRPAVRRRVRPAPVDRARRDLALEGPAVDRGRADAVSGASTCAAHARPQAGDTARPSVLSRAAATAHAVRCDVLAVGTELLLGQIIDSNSAWMGGELAANGIDSLVQVKVGDNVGRIDRQLGGCCATPTR